MASTATVSPVSTQAQERPPALPPGPRLPFYLQSYLNWQHMVPFLSWAQRRYGDVFTLRILPWGRAIVIADPELIKEIVTGPAEVFQAGASNRGLLERVVGSRGLLTIDDEEHMATRKRMLPPFHGESVRAYEQIVREMTEQRVAQWPIGETISMHRESREVTLEVILRAVFGAEDSRWLPELRQALRRVTHITFLVSLWAAWPRLGVAPPWRGYAAAVDRTNELIDELIDERRDEGNLEERTDILSLLLRAGENDPAWLRDQVMNLLLAGHETTTTGLSWAVLLLAQNPDVQARAREGDDAYLDAVVTETLRLRTVIPGVTRRLSEPATVGPYRFPAGVTLLGGSLLLHRDPRLYDAPEEFRPERWLDERPGTYTWFPFGGGRRRCIGAAFAQLEMRVALRTILAHAEFRPARRRPERQRNFHITLIPSHRAQIVRTA
jgi:cytochrome P450